MRRCRLLLRGFWLTARLLVCSAHFLDVGEFLTAFAIGYDWFYDAWTEEQRTALM